MRAATSTQTAVRDARPYLQLTRNIAHQVALTGPVGGWAFRDKLAQLEHGTTLANRRTGVSALLWLFLGARGV